MKVTTERAKARLQMLIDSANNLSGESRQSANFKKWQRDSEVAVENIFGDGTRHMADLQSVRYALGAFSSRTLQSEHHDAYLRGLDTAKGILKSMIEEIDEYWGDDAEQKSSPIQTSPAEPKEGTNEVFIVHGRDDGAKETTARFLSKLGLNPIILHEQADQGQTVIEKFERHAKVGFAIVLLTPDDVGGLAGDDPELRPRARQNVILELGHFIGSLGRSRVCALVKEELELPSDYAGVVYVPMDSGGVWKMRLVKELKSSGYVVDANNAI